MLMRSQDESMKLDDLVFHVGRESLSKSGLRSHGDGVATFPVGVLAIGRFKFTVSAEFFCLESKHHAANWQTCNNNKIKCQWSNTMNIHILILWMISDKHITPDYWKWKNKLNNAYLDFADRWTSRLIADPSQDT